MNNGSIKKLALVLLVAALIAGMYACSQKKSLLKWHPVEVTAAPNCADCHKDDRAALNHTPDFATRHKFYTMQRKEVCDLCHVESFCTDCHAHKEEIKPRGASRTGEIISPSIGSTAGSTPRRVFRATAA